MNTYQLNKSKFPQIISHGLLRVAKLWIEKGKENSVRERNLENGKNFMLNLKKNARNQKENIIKI